MANIDVSVERAENGDRFVRFVPPLDGEQLLLIQSLSPSLAEEAFTSDDESTRLRIETAGSSNEWADGVALNRGLRSAGILSQSGEDVHFLREVQTIGSSALSIVEV